MRTSVRIGAGLLLALLVCGSAPAAAQPTRAIPGSNEASPTSNPEKDRYEIEKLRAELKKIEQETTGLEYTNQELTRKFQMATAVAGAIGSIFGVLVAGFALFIGRRLNTTQQDKLKQDKELELQKHQLESRKIEQERKLGREKHLLEIFKGLGEEQATRVRIGSVAILVQRIRTIRRDNPQADPDNADELPTIVSVLIAASKHEPKPEIQKQIADGLAQSLGAIVPDGQQPTSAESPLKPYDFQGAQLENAWWRMIDARSVDFYGAHLARAGLRKAFLSGTILKKAKLAGSTLEDAKLDGADLQDADLTNTKMARVDLRNAKLARADFSGADLRNAIFLGSNFTEARFTGANITGADFGGAPPPPTT